MGEWLWAVVVVAVILGVELFMRVRSLPKKGV